MSQEPPKRQPIISQPTITRSRTSSGGGSMIAVMVIVIGAVIMMSMCVIGILAALLLPAVNAARDAARRAQSIDNVRQIGTAMLSYATAKGRFPPQHSVDEQGSPLHSWRTLLLPYLGREDLLAQFDLEKPWDEPGNLAAASKDIELLLSPRYGQSGNLTNYVVVTGEGHVFDGDVKTSLAAIAQRDGLANTILIVEIANSDIQWAEPRDLSIDELAFEADAGPDATNVVRSTAVVGFADGRALALDPAESLQDLRAKLTYNGGEIVGDW